MHFHIKPHDGTAVSIRASLQKAQQMTKAVRAWVDAPEPSAPAHIIQRNKNMLTMLHEKCAELAATLRAAEKREGNVQ